MRIGDGVVRRPRRTQMLGKIAAGTQVILPLFARLVQGEWWNADGTVRAQVNGLFEEGLEPLRIAIGCQSHDLVLVGAEIETQVERHQ
ncbi:MAG: hypothetical protein K2Q25_00660 [Mycobacteriaceae bacterium]|nr:hypothetical protein [Mycobacteriaceae bacterium]